MPNILITTFGATWQEVPELLGFTNPGLVDLYANHPRWDGIDMADCVSGDELDAFSWLDVDEIRDPWNSGRGWRLICWMTNKDRATRMLLYNVPSFRKYAIIS